MSYCAILKLAYDWQTLIAGILALVGAGVGAALLSRQINQARQQAGEERGFEKERLARRNEAARAIMPLALNSLSTYAEDSARALVTLLDSSDEGVSIALPEVPEGIVEDFAGMIEASEASHAAPFTALLSNLQVQIARITLVSRNSERLLGGSRSISVTERLYEAVYIHAATSALLMYVRDKPEAQPDLPTWELMHASMKTIGLTSGRQIDLEKLVESKKARHARPSLS